MANDKLEERADFRGAELNDKYVCPVCFREYGNDGIKYCTSELCPSVNVAGERA